MASFWKIQVELYRHQLGSEAVVWVYTHRPLVAAARCFAHARPFPASKDEMDTLDPTLLPYCIFQCEADGLLWRELPRHE